MIAIPGLIGLCLLIAGVKLRQLYSKALMDGRKVRGTLVAHVKKYSGTRSLNRLIKVYVDGQDRYVLSADGSYPPSGTVGDHVDVYISKRDPNKAMVPTNLIPIMSSFFMSSGFFCIGAAIYTYLYSNIGSFIYFDIGMAVVLGLILVSKYKSLIGNSVMGRNFRKALQKSVYQDFLTQDEAENMMAGKNEPVQMFSRRHLEKDLHLKRKTAKSTSRITGLIFACIGAAIIYFGIYKVQETQKFKQTATRVQGKIVDRKINRGSGTTYTPIIEFQPEGHSQPIRIKGAFSSSHPRWKIGDPATVLYDKNDPMSAIQDDGIFNYFLPLFLFIFGGMFLLVGITSASGIKDRKKLKPKEYRKHHSAG